MSKRKMFIVVLVLLVAVPAFVFAQEEQKESQMQPQQEQQTAGAQEYMRLDQVIGATVMDKSNQTGTITNCVIQPDGKISYVAVAFPQAGGGETYLIPRNKVSYSNGKVSLDVTQNDLSSLETMSGDQLPQSIASKEKNSALATQIEKFSVVGDKGQQIGQVSGAMLDLNNMRLDYLAVAPSGQLGMSEALYAVPPGDIKAFSSNNNQVSLSINEDHFKNLQGFSQNNWPQKVSK